MSIAGKMVRITKVPSSYFKVAQMNFVCVRQRARETASMYVLQKWGDIDSIKCSLLGTFRQQ